MHIRGETMSNFTIPPLNWFESNPWAKVGNKYCGSIGATSINNNAFLFEINYYRLENEGVDKKVPELHAKVFDSITKMNKSEDDVTTKIFSGSEQGRLEMLDWLEYMYKEFVESGKDKLKIHFVKK